MNRFGYLIRLTGPEWTEFKEKHFKYEKAEGAIIGSRTAPPGWNDKYMRVVQLWNMDVIKIEYDGPLNGDALELLEELVEYPVLGENDPLGS